VAAAPDGRLSFAWHTDNQDGSGLAIYSRLFDAAGAPTGGEFRVNTYTTGHQSLPSISADASGNFVVVWTDYGQQDGSGRGMFGQRFDSLGAAQGTEFRVNSYTTGNQYNFASAVAASADGRFVVVWESSGQDGSDGGVFAQRYDKTGVALGSEFQVNTHTPAFQINPSVASDPAGNFVVVWTSAGQPGGDAFDVVGRRYDAAGVPQGPEFIVNSETAGVQDYGKVAYDPRGNFVVVWDGYGPADSYDVFGRAFNHAGPVTADFALSTFTTGVQRAPTIASNAAGDFVVAWTNSASGASEIFARRFLSDLIFKDDFEGGDSRQHVSGLAPDVRRGTPQG
jgi:hypothetical protein